MVCSALLPAMSQRKYERTISEEEEDGKDEDKKNYEDDEDDDDNDDDEDGNDCKVGQWTPLQGCPVSAPAG